MGVGEKIIFRILYDLNIRFSANEVRRELCYLRDRHLILIEGENATNGSAC